MKTALPLLAALALAACTSQTDEPTSAPHSGLGRTAAVQDGSKPGVPVTKPKPDDTKPKLTRTVTCREGDGERTLWLSEDLVVEIEPTELSRGAMLLSDPGAIEVEQSQAGVRVWRVAAVQGIDVFADNLSSGSQRFSPVLHETSSPGSPMLALPGGVLATFKGDWERARIDGWLAARKLKVEGEIGAGLHTYLIQTPPGLASLDTSNQLAQTGELVSCEPNWWRQASTR